MTALDGFGEGEKSFGREGGDDSLRASLEELRIEGVFEGIEASPDRRGIDAELLCGSQERARAPQREESSDVVPTVGIRAQHVLHYCKACQHMSTFQDSDAKPSLGGSQGKTRP